MTMILPSPMQSFSHDSMDRGPRVKLLIQVNGRHGRLQLARCAMGTGMIIGPGEDMSLFAVFGCARV